MEDQEDIVVSEESFEELERICEQPMPEEMEELLSKKRRWNKSDQ